MAAKMIAAKYPGTCRYCERRFGAGERIAYQGAGLIHHEACYAREIEEERERQEAEDRRWEEDRSWMKERNARIAAGLEIEMAERTIGDRVALTVKGAADYRQAFAAARMYAYVTGRTIQTFKNRETGKRAPSGTAIWGSGSGHPAEIPMFHGYRFYFRPVSADTARAA